MLCSRIGGTSWWLGEKCRRTMMEMGLVPCELSSWQAACCLSYILLSLSWINSSPKNSTIRTYCPSLPAPAKRFDTRIHVIFLSHCLPAQKERIMYSQIVDQGWLWPVPRVAGGCPMARMQVQSSQRGVAQD